MPVSLSLLAPINRALAREFWLDMNKSISKMNPNKYDHAQR